MPPDASRTDDLPSTLPTLRAGRELDALVAERVMGLQPCSDPIGRCEGAHLTPCQCWGLPDRQGVVAGGELAAYSTDLTAAWTVVERLGVTGYTITLDHNLDHPYQVECWTPDGREQKQSIEVHADTAPLAICLAALKAVGA